MNLKLIINRGLIVIDSLVKGYQSPSGIIDKNVLIVFQQAFGDSIVLQNSLAEYVKLYPKENGYQVRLIAQPSVLRFMQDNLPIPKDIQCESVDFKRLHSDFFYYRKVVKKFRGFASTIIVPGVSFSGELFSTSNDGCRKIGLIRCIDLTKPFIMAVFARLAFTETVRPDKTDMMLQRHRKLIHYLGNSSFKAKLPVLIKKPRIIIPDYAVLCPGASLMEKCWPTERFAEIADYITDNYDLQIHLCGGADEVAFETAILSKVKHPKNITSHIGKTSFSDWSAIVQHAEIVVGNDSATMHLAAAGRVKAVCIAGVYDKYQFFPYKVDELSEGDRLPVTVYKDMPCEWCRTIGYFAGYGNAECKKQIENNQCAICIDKITVNEVKEAIDKLLKE